MADLYKLHATINADGNIRIWHASDDIFSSVLRLQSIGIWWIKFFFLYFFFKNTVFNHFKSSYFNLRSFYIYHSHYLFIATIKLSATWVRCADWWFGHDFLNWCNINSTFSEISIYIYFTHQITRTTHASARKFIQHLIFCWPNNEYGHEFVFNGSYQISFDVVCHIMAFRNRKLAIANAEE